MNGDGERTEPREPQPALLLRPWAESDAAGLREAIDEDLGHLKPWLSWTLEEPATLERTRVRLRRWDEEFQAGRSLRYAIAPLDRPSLILGGAHLKQRAAASAQEVGYWVRKSAARQGIAGAAVSRLAVQAFEERGVDRLVLQCDVANDASAAFARSLGFRLVGSVTGTYPDGAPRPVLEFEMSRAGYWQHHAPALGERSRRVRLVTDAPTPPTGPRGRPAGPEHASMTDPSSNDARTRTGMAEGNDA